MNLDYLAAVHAQAIVNKGVAGGYKGKAIDNVVTKALGVLQGDGIYALMLYLLSRSRDEEKVIAGGIRDNCLGLLAALPYGWGQPQGNRADLVLAHMTGTVMGGDTSRERLLLAKQILEQMLIYGRYGAQAAEQMPGNGERQGA